MANAVKENDMFALWRHIEKINKFLTAYRSVGFAV